MVNEIRVSDPCWSNKERDSKFRVGSRVRPETPEEGRRTHWPKRCEYNSNDKDNSPKNPNDKNNQASSQTFRQSNEYVSNIMQYVYFVLDHSIRFLLACLTKGSVFGANGRWNIVFAFSSYKKW